MFLTFMRTSLIVAHVASTHARSLEHHDRQGRQGDDDRLRPRVPYDRRRRDTAEIPLAASALERSVAVQNLLTHAAPGNTQPMVLARDGREVARNEHRLVGAPAAAKEGDRALLGVVAVDPLEARLVA